MRTIIFIGWTLWAIRVCLGEERPMESAMKEAGTNGAAKAVYAMFGAGCFWCTEAAFQRIPGVIKVESGYAGGHVRNPTYRDVCTGETGHAEVVRVVFDPGKCTYDALLDLFWRIHDPTTLNRQGADEGTQYRSVIFYYSEEQRAMARQSQKRQEASGRYTSAIVTTLEKAGDFFPAEENHRDYYNRNPSAPYCRMVIEPKLRKAGLAK